MLIKPHWQIVISWTFDWHATHFSLCMRSFLWPINAFYSQHSLKQTVLFTRQRLKKWNPIDFINPNQFTLQMTGAGEIFQLFKETFIIGWSAPDCNYKRKSQLRLIRHHHLFSPRVLCSLFSAITYLKRSKKSFNKSLIKYDENNC